MADVVASVTKAPEKAIGFAKNNMLAFVLVALVVLIAVVAYQARNPGKIEEKVSKIPGVGKWALRAA
jgi:hypothetical protein